MLRDEYPEYRATKENPHQVSCGGVVYRVGIRDKVEVLLLHRFKSKKWKYDSWHLPKGTQRVEETQKECAKREIKEETGFEVEVGKKLIDIESTFDMDGFTAHKTTHFFICTLLRRVGIGDREHDERKWVDLNEAKKLLGEFPIWEDEKRVLEEFEKQYNYL